MGKGLKKFTYLIACLAYLLMAIPLNLLINAILFPLHKLANFLIEKEIK